MITPQKIFTSFWGFYFKNVFEFKFVGANKGISNITYNLLNLPEEVTFTNGNSIKFFYSAEGVAATITT